MFGFNFAYLHLTMVCTGACRSSRNWLGWIFRRPDAGRVSGTLVVTGLRGPG